MNAQSINYAKSFERPQRTRQLAASWPSWFIQSKIFKAKLSIYLHHNLNYTKFWRCGIACKDPLYGVRYIPKSFLFYWFIFLKRLSAENSQIYKIAAVLHFSSFWWNEWSALGNTIYKLIFSGNCSFINTITSQEWFLNIWNSFTLYAFEQLRILFYTYYIVSNYKYIKLT